MNKLEKTIILSFSLLVFFPSCAGDIKGERGEAALASTTLILRGGGKISWNSSQNRVTFTEEISVYDQITNSTITITPSASPITLADKNDVAYVARSTSQDASIKMTEVTVAPITELSSATQANDVIPLFQRTEDDILWLPWLQRELLDGDHIQFGAGTSWYERMASARKPAYENTSSGGTTITVPASSASPAVVIIDGKLFANTENTLCKFSPGASETGCLDTGTIQANTPYYLYSVPSESNRSFSIVASETDPAAGGPPSIETWSYIGAVATHQDNATFTVFQASEGLAIYTDEIWSDTNSSTTRKEVTMTNLPLTARSAFLQLIITGTSDTGIGAITSLNLSEDSLIVSRLSTSGSYNSAGPVLVPVIVPQSTWIYTSTSMNTAGADLMGWKEDPMSFN